MHNLRLSLAFISSIDNPVTNPDSSDLQMMPTGRGGSIIKYTSSINWRESDPLKERVERQ